ncbi:MAG: glycosyltransferase [Treponema sp.]|nr:glycosyltransferase [Treponema sp.]
MLKETKISVIMLTYNREQYVSRAIESIIKQTFVDFEFIIVDNGSSDKSGVIADEYAANDNRIKVIHRECGNIGSGRNAGLDIAKGDYIAFIDDDDWAEPDFLDFLYNLALNNNADIAICGSYRKNEDGNIEPKYIFNDMFLHNAETSVKEMVLREYYNSGTPTKLFKKSLFDNIRFPNSGKYDDISTTYKLFANAVLTAAYGVGKYYFTRHFGNNSGAATKHELLNSQQLNEYLTVFKERTDYLSRVLPNLADFAKWSEWSYMISMAEKIKRLSIMGCEKPYAFMLDELKQNRNAFYNSVYTRDFEREWMDQQI